MSVQEDEASRKRDKTQVLESRKARARLLRFFFRLFLDALMQLHLKLLLANAISGLLPDFVSGTLRGRLYGLIGFAVHPTVFIAGNMRLNSTLPGFYDKLVIERDAVIGDHVAINLDARVFLGKNVSLGPHVLMHTGTHLIGPGSQRRMPAVVAKPIIVEDGAWIGLGATILAGVTIGRGSVVAAGAVVTEDVPPNSYVEGNPARVVSQLPWGDR